MYKCAQCVAEFIQWANSESKDEKPEVNDAITLAPAWQMQQIGMQQVWGIVALPTCMRHLDVQKRSSLDRAVLGGRLLGGVA